MFSHTCQNGNPSFSRGVTLAVAIRLLRRISSRRRRRRLVRINDDVLYLYLTYISQTSYKKSMSAPRAAVQRMRILALPLTSHASSSGRHIYYHFQTPPRAGASTNQKPGLVKMATAKAAEMWAGFGKAPEGSWKVSSILFFFLKFRRAFLSSNPPSLFSSKMS